VGSYGFIKGTDLVFTFNYRKPEFRVYEGSYFMRFHCPSEEYPSKTDHVV